MIRTIFLFVLAGLAEIAGGYFIWLWLREGFSYWYGMMGAVILVFYGVIPTLQSFSSFGRIYAAYGGFLSFFPCYGDGALIRKRPMFTNGSALRSA